MSPIAKIPDVSLWRGFDELEGHAPASGTAVFGFEQNRREFLKLMGASLALAGLESCTKMPKEKIFPRVSEAHPGHERHYFASSCLFRGFSKGMVVTSDEGRPTKIEGNALHPGSGGKSDIFSQAELLSLYDPERSKAVLNLGETSTWDAFTTMLKAQGDHWRSTEGKGVRILTGTITSPTLSDQLALFLKKYPKAAWHCYEPINTDSVREGAMLVFGKDVRSIYHFDRADVVVSLDADFLGPGIAQQAYAQGFAAKRSVSTKSGSKSFNRLYVIESSVSITGSVADHRLALTPSKIMGFLQALAHKLGIALHEKPPSWTDAYQRQVEVIAHDLLANASRSIVIAGELQHAGLNALVHVINERLSNHGRTIEFILPPEANPVNQTSSFKELLADLEGNQVETLIILGTNPVYASPKSFGFNQHLAKAKLKIHLGLYEDETSYLCDWHMPESHVLESFGDARAFDGTVALQQPLIAPFYDSRSSLEVMAMLRGEYGSSFTLVRDYWAKTLSDDCFKQSLHDGVIADTRHKPIRVELNKNFTIPKMPSHHGLEIAFRPDPTVFDGRYANSSWLQELPKPILQLTWDNAALMSIKTAHKYALGDEDVVTLSLNDRHVNAPVLIVPGHPDDSVTVTFGYGRTMGSLSAGRGFNAYHIFDAHFHAGGLTLKKTNQKYVLARTHTHHSMEKREIVRRGSLSSYQRISTSIVPKSAKAPVATLLKNRLNGLHAWGMVIDLNTCIGCNTCTIACQAENNIPVVGKEQVSRSREMHWIRVDRYFEGSPENPRTFFQPVPCMHCETAPCEVVCPTAATNHNAEGINQMVYNRCVGTRYCSNNCPYKVRRFNFLQFSDMKTTNFKLMYNPEVTVRSRGVMEKCTYCIQRIERVRIDAQKEDRAIKDGEITPACAQACPTNAIVFGDLNAAKSQVKSLKALPLDYQLLHETGTKPRTSYLAKLYNDNPKWESD